MAIGTAFTLFFVPAIYVLIARDHRAERAVEREAPLPAGIEPTV
jgi:multidrug efflux pump